MELVRITLASGAGFPIAPDDPSLAHVVVESGELTVRYPAAVEMLATPRVVAWDTIAITAGSGAVGLPPMGELRNDDSEPAVLLVLSVVPTSAAGVTSPATAAAGAAGSAEDVAEPGRITFDPGEVPDGVCFQPLAVGHVEELPAEAWSVAIVRLTAEPGAVFPADESAEVELAAVEAGSLVFTTTGGPPLRVVRGPADTDVLATPGPEPAAEEGSGRAKRRRSGRGTGSSFRSATSPGPRSSATSRRRRCWPSSRRRRRRASPDGANQPCPSGCTLNQCCAGCRDDGNHPQCAGVGGGFATQLWGGAFANALTEHRGRRRP